MHIFSRFIFFTLIALVLLYSLGKWLLNSYPISLNYSLNTFFTFHLSLSFAVLFVIFTIDNLSHQHTAFAFLATSVLRMLAIVIFIFPLAQKTTATPMGDVAFLLIPYFVLMPFEAVFAIRLIQKNHNTQGK